MPGAAPAVTTHDLDFVDGYRSDYEFEKAKRHSGIVRWLKIILPVIAVLIILFVLGALVVRQMLSVELDLGQIKMDGGKLVMENPNLKGVDENSRPYFLTADRAIQDAANPTVVELQRISATLPMDESISAEVVAGNGVYDADAKTLVLRETVEVTTTSGIFVRLDNADVDIEKGTLRTTSPVTATSPQADISSATLNVEGGGERLVFEGTVRMVLRPKGDGVVEGTSNE